MGEATHIVMNLKTAYDRFSEVDHHRLFDGAYFNEEELNTFRGVTASCGIQIEKWVDNDVYLVVLEDGAVESHTW